MQKYKPETGLITGAANGIGKALSFELANRGSHLALIDIDYESLKELKSSLDRLPVKISIHKADLGDVNEIDKAGLEIENIHDNINLLINCAGVSIKGELTYQKTEDIEWITRINYLAPILVCRRMLRLFKKDEPGRIVNVSSGAGLQGFAGRTTYCASKFGLRGFSEALKAELFRTGIKVCCAYPGPVDTLMSSRSRYTDERFRGLEKKYLAEKGYDPAYVAKRILKGAQTGKPHIYIGKEIAMMFHMKRLFPILFSNYLYKNQDKLPG